MVRLQLDSLRQQLQRHQSLCRRLERIAARLETGTEVSIDEFIHTIEETNMSSQMDAELRQRFDELHRDTSAQRIREVEETEWPRLYEDVRAAIKAGLDPTGDEARTLARRWHGLVAEFTKGDPEVARAVARRNADDPTAGGNMPGDMRAMMEFIATVPTGC